MTLFLLTFLALYGGMHAYLYYRLKSIMQPGMLVPLSLILLTIAPLLVRLAESSGMSQLAYFIALPGFIWMGFIFLVSVFLGIVDTAYLFWRRAVAAASNGSISAMICWLGLISAFLATGYSLIEARTIRTEHLTIRLKQPHTLKKPLRVVQISDVHIGLMMDDKRLGGIITAVTDAKPDILVSTGDLVDGRLSRQNSAQSMDKFAIMLKTITAPLGKYAIAGNHEYYAGIDDALKLTQKAGFAVLINQTVRLPSGVTISGVHDPAAEKMGLTIPRTEHELVATLPAAPFNILLKHRPLLQHDSDGKIDLQLSGHTHKGQLIPFYPLTWLKFPIHSGTTKTEKGTTIHVSRGTGTWGPPMRFFAPPEVTVIDIVP